VGLHSRKHPIREERKIRKGKGQKENEEKKKRENKRKWGLWQRRKRKREGDVFRGLKERGY